jgi:hypothetical protein
MNSENTLGGISTSIQDDEDDSLLLLLAQDQQLIQI